VRFRDEFKTTVLKSIRSNEQWKEIFGLIITMTEESPSRENFFGIKLRTSSSSYIVWMKKRRVRLDIEMKFKRFSLQSAERI
jgi:hypothetical protein